MLFNSFPSFTFQELIDASVLEIGDGYRAKNNELGGNGAIFLRAGHVTDSHIDFNGVEYFHVELAEKLLHKMSRVGDTVITTKGNSTGRTSYVTERMPSFVYSPHLSYWRSKDANQVANGFLRYWSQGREFKDQLSAMKTSTDMAPYLSLTDQRRLRISLPPIETQIAIANILGSLDDKIELNRRMNETLEGIARALFKSWFVDFDPVRAKMDGRQPAGMAPEIADLFPSEFEHVNGELVPKGWSTGIIGNVGVNPRRSITPEQITMGTPYIALEHMPRRCIALSEWSDSEGISSGKCLFNRGEILFGKLRPYFHKVGVPAVSGVCSTDIIVVVPSSDAWFGFLLGHMSSDALVEYTDLTSTGTKMPRTNWNDIAKYPVVLPPETIAALFADYMRAIVAQIHANVHESKSLSQVRDTLLPKLLSGELRVPDADKMVEEVL